MYLTAGWCAFRVCQELTSRKRVFFRAERKFRHFFFPPETRPPDRRNLSLQTPQIAVQTPASDDQRFNETIQRLNNDLIRNQTLELSNERLILTRDSRLEACASRRVPRLRLVDKGRAAPIPQGPYPPPPTPVSALRCRDTGRMRR